jgi:hypothetical protein
MMQKALFGALAGLSATMAMTTVMRHLFVHLDTGERYPLPPRELTENILHSSKHALPGLTVLSHFGYGALAGALYGLFPDRTRTGALYGIAVWAASYLGWIPAMHILKPATLHPQKRNFLMLAAHVVWGTALAFGLHELRRSTDDVFATGQNKDGEGSAPQWRRA